MTGQPGYNTEMVPDPVRDACARDSAGRVLFLTEDAGLVRAQLDGRDLEWDANDPGHGLRNDVSTDEITPGWVCFHYDEALGRFAYLGLTGRGASGTEKPVREDDVRRGGFVASVAGRRRGKGSSREAAPFAEKAAGIRILVAESLERIYKQNAINLGLLVTDDFSVLEKVRRSETIPVSFFTEGLDEISAEIVRRGGLFAYQRARRAGETSPARPTMGPRPLTLGEKILARAWIADARSGEAGVAAVAPGDAGFVRADLRFSHEYVTPMAAAFLRANEGADARPAHPESLLFFQDHLNLLGEVMPEEQRRRGLLDLARGLGFEQERVARAWGVRLHGAGEGICHSLVTERYARPGQLVVGSDSHTPHAGALGCLAFGIGTTDLATAWLSRDVRVSVPRTVRVTLDGRLPAGVAAKDAMLALLAHPFVRNGGAIGKILEYGGDAVSAMPLDERATLTNMSAEAGGFTGIVAPDATTARFLADRRGMPLAEAERLCEGLGSDPGAEFETEIRLDVSQLAPLVALPGDPGNGVRIADLAEPVRIDVAYAGSCTAGKREDVALLAAVVGEGLARGARVAPGVRFYVQFGSDDVARWAAAQGFTALFERAGAIVLPPGCGACIAAGPGVSTRPDEVTVSAINRNFPGRSGPGRVWLASPAVVAASALAGEIRAWRPAPPSPS